MSLYADPRGSIVATARLSGTSVINSYDSFGVPDAMPQGQIAIDADLASKGRFRYTGQVWLPEIGLYYYKARMYSPTLGRFLQTDPIGYEDDINLYAYVANDPVNGVDPTGMQEEDEDRLEVVIPALIGDGEMSASVGLDGVSGSISNPLYTVNVEFDFDGRIEVDGSVDIGNTRASAGYELDASNNALRSSLRTQLQTESFAAQFNSDGTLTDDAISSSTIIIASSDLNNVAPGFSKWSTPAMEIDGKNWQVHFYRDDKTGAVWYGQDYKSKSN